MKQALIDRPLAEKQLRSLSGRGALRGWSARGRPAAFLASSSKSAAAMLPPEPAYGRPLLSIFDADPALFLLAAMALKVPPTPCVVLEDAPACIAAARAGGMALVGIARLGDKALLQAAQAGLVVTSPQPDRYCRRPG
jgi:beta-phosphoglucomutase-like phosphatase (HAD superfamily)